ncbi:hypothetical protein MPER_04783 [Moniliophthora perniciosa FA553]|nr:hypothetical protein MPER_04783 [Moniliophthora perniciosa FA553]
MRFFVPFPIASKLWSHADPSVRQESLSLIEHYQDGWNAYPGPEEKGDERLAFIAALIRHLKRDYGGHRSILFTSDQGTDFIHFIRNEIIQHRLYEPSYWESDGNHRSVLIREWVAAIHQYWFNLVEGDVGTITVQSVGALNDSISRFREMGLPKAINLCYFVPFPIASKLWSHADPSVRQESLSLIEYYRDGWNAYAGPEEKGDERLAFIAALIKHKQDYGEHRSILFTSDQGTDFISIHS